MKKQKGNIYVLSGPSGVGKTVISERLLKKCTKLKRIVTYTSRGKRKGEKQKRDYFFVSANEFKKRIDQNFFLEWAEVHGNLYGTPKPDIEKHLKKGNDILLVIDVQGALNVKKEKTESILVFLKPDNMKYLESRIKKRKQNMSNAELKTRMTNAKKELAIAKRKYDHIITNSEDKINKTINDIGKIIECRNT